jgi:hypothetical protein
MFPKNSLSFGMLYTFSLCLLEEKGNMGSLYELESIVLTTSIILTGKAPLMPPDSLHHRLLDPWWLTFKRDSTVRVRTTTPSAVHWRHWRQGSTRICLVHLQVTVV